MIYYFIEGNYGFDEKQYFDIISKSPFRIIILIKTFWYFRNIILNVLEIQNHLDVYIIWRLKQLYYYIVFRHKINSQHKTSEMCVFLSHLNDQSIVEFEF